MEGPAEGEGLGRDSRLPEVLGQRGGLSTQFQSGLHLRSPPPSSRLFMTSSPSLVGGIVPG